MTSYLEKGKSRIKIARKQATFDVWLDTTGSVISLDLPRNDKLYLPVTGGPYFLTGLDCQNQSEHSDFEVREGRSTRFFMVASESEVLCLLMCHAFHIYVQYLMAEKKKLVGLLHLEETTFPACFSSDTGTCKMEDIAGGALIVYDTTPT